MERRASRGHRVTLIGACLVLGCGKQRTDSRPADAQTGDAAVDPWAAVVATSHPDRNSCTLPTHEPAALVFAVARSQVGIAGKYRHESGAITVDGLCGTDVCIHVSAATMHSLYEKVRATARTSRSHEPVPPHYINRSIEVRWQGGQCLYFDIAAWPLAKESAPAFDDAHGALMEIVTQAARDR